MGTQIDLIAGLGNPDPEYLRTRHNAGFWFVDALAANCGTSFGHNKKLSGDTAEVGIGQHRIRLLKPMTYMNESGRSVGQALSYFKIAPERLLVVYDEIDLATGRVQLKFGGGHAGHNGMRSIIDHVGPNFWRLRLGVGHPGRKERVAGHVLKRASTEEEALIIDSIRDALEALPVMLDQGAEKAKTQLHSRKPPTDNADDQLSGSR